MHLKRLMRKLDILIDIIVTLLFFLIIVFVVYQVFTRNFGIPNTWSEELIRWLFVYFSFLGIAYLVRKDTHVRLNVIDIIKPLKKISIVMDIPFIILNMIFFVICTYAGLMLFIHHGGFPSASLGVDKKVMFFVVPISFGLMTLYEIIKLSERLSSKRTEEKKDEDKEG